MQRRTFLQSALWSPLLVIPAASPTASAVTSLGARSAGTLPTGLSSLDAVLGGIVPGTFRGFTGVGGPPDLGTKLGLWQLAVRICEHYTTNVLFYDATGCVIDVRQQLATRPFELAGRSESLESRVDIDDRLRGRPRVHLIDSAAIEGKTGFDLAARLGRGSIQGYSLIILDGWSTYIDQSLPVRRLGNGALAPGERIAESTISVHQMVQISRWAVSEGLPFLGGVSTASEGSISPATLAVDAALREYPDRRVFLYRSTFFCGTDDWRRGHPPTWSPKFFAFTGDNPGAPNWSPAAYQRKPSTTGWVPG